MADFTLNSDIRQRGVRIRRSVRASWLHQEFSNYIARFFTKANGSTPCPNFPHKGSRLFQFCRVG